MRLSHLTTSLSIASLAINVHAIPTTPSQVILDVQDVISYAEEVSDVSFPTERDDPPIDGMIMRKLSISGPAKNRVNLVFFGDGYTSSEEDKFFSDAQSLTDDVVRPDGAFGLVKPLLNIWAVYVPSIESGIGDHDTPKNTPFGLYRPGPELRGVYYTPESKRKVIDACRWFREGGGDGEGGCDEAVLLGNDPLYGGLGGTPTVITASKINGPMVLRHELGHTLIPVGEEYDGGFVYDGVNAAPVSALEHDNLSWAHWLTSPPRFGEKVRMEDVKVPLQAYPWHNLSTGDWSATFNSSKGEYPTSLLRFSISSIPSPSHLNVTISSMPIPFSLLPESEGSKDRAWVEVALDQGLEGLTAKRPGEEMVVNVGLTKAGWEAGEGQGGKMITSLEILEYGVEDRYNGSMGYIGAFPTYAEDGSVTLRPLNEECLMRRVTYPTFCPVCLEGLVLSLAKRISLIDSLAISCSDGATIQVSPIEFSGARYSISWRLNGKYVAELDDREIIDVEDYERGMWEVEVELHMKEVRLTGKEEMKARGQAWFSGC